MNTLTAAVVGTGFIGPVHVEGLRRLGVAIAGVAASTHEKAKAAAERLSLPRAYASFDEMLADASVEVVHIATPNRLHFDQASRALRAGKHVLCEKPLAMTSSESATLVELAAKSGVAAGVNYNIRYYPLCLEAAERVRNETLGDVWHVSGGYVQDWLFHARDFNWRVMESEGGALRAIADIGTHWLDLIQFIAGKHISEVCADLQTVHSVRERPEGGAETFSGAAASRKKTIPTPIATEDAGRVIFRFSDGAAGAMHVSQVTAGRKNCLTFELAGSKQSLAFNSERPNELWIGHRDKPSELLVRDPALMTSRAGGRSSYPGGHNEGFGDTFKQLFADFYEDIATGAFATEPRFPTFADGHHEILLCEAILESYRHRRWTTVGKPR